MANDKIVRFPINSSKRLRNRLGKRAVPCEVTGRWLQFPETSHPLSDGNYMFVDVMTTDGERSRKLCSVCISKEDIERALSNVRDC